MLQFAVMVLALLSLGLGWMVYRLLVEREHDYKLERAIERAIYDAGWLAEYQQAHIKAVVTLAEQRSGHDGGKKKAAQAAAN